MEAKQLGKKELMKLKYPDSDTRGTCEPINQSKGNLIVANPNEKKTKKTKHKQNINRNKKIKKRDKEVQTAPPVSAGTKPSRKSNLK